jgi:hypothetical protein
MIEARSLNYMGWDGALVSALGGEVWEPPPHATLSAEFVFSVPAPARIKSSAVTPSRSTSTAVDAERSREYRSAVRSALISVGAAVR